jgi:hypothetical protein
LQLEKWKEMRRPPLLTSELRFCALFGALGTTGQNREGLDTTGQNREGKVKRKTNIMLYCRSIKYTRFYSANELIPFV